MKIKTNVTFDNKLFNSDHSDNAAYADYDDYTDFADFADYAKIANYADYTDYAHYVSDADDADYPKWKLAQNLNKRIGQLYSDILKCLVPSLLVCNSEHTDNVDFD